MNRVGIVSYNINCNFTNYGSALQSWALKTVVERLGCRASLVDYCPKVHLCSDPLNPYKNMWDKDVESRRMCELSMPAIRENYAKFERFYTERFNRTKRKYTAENLDDIVQDEHVDGFVCGSDTIFCVDEFKGLEDGYFANCPCMRGKAVAYAASFGDSHFTPETFALLNSRLSNFKAIGLRESAWIEYCKKHAAIPIERVVDPTFLLTRDDYDRIAESKDEIGGPYLLLYVRRYSKEMEDFAVSYARQHDLRVVEISLRATNSEKGHLMRYGAGVEEFLSLTRNATCVVTNSFHGLIFAVQYARPFAIFSREQADSKIKEVLNLIGMEDVADLTFQAKAMVQPVRDVAYDRITEARSRSLDFLQMELDLLR